MNCYFPMPFNKRAKIEVINENERPLGLFFHIDYELYHEELRILLIFRPLGDVICHAVDGE